MRGKKKENHNVAASRPSHRAIKPLHDWDSSALYVLKCW